MKNIIIYTGYTFEALLNENDDVTNEILNNIDYLIDGPFILEKRDISLKFKGSTNQRIIDIKKSLSENQIIIKEF